MNNLTIKSLSILMVLLLSACGGGGEEPPPGGPPTQIEKPERNWDFRVYPADGTGTIGTDYRDVVIGGVVDERHDFGPLIASPSSTLGKKERAEGEIFSNETGKTYWVWAEAPTGGAVAGVRPTLVQSQIYSKDRPNSTLEMVITKAFIEAIDFNAGDIFLSSACPWVADLEGASSACAQVMRGELRMEVIVVRRTNGPIDLYKDSYGNWGSKLQLHGWAGHWNFSAPALVSPRGLPLAPIWKESDFEFDSDASGDGTQTHHATVKLREAVTFKVDLSKVDHLEEFVVLTLVRADVLNRRGGESYLAAYLRDPVNGTGLGEVQHITSGLTAVDKPFSLPAPAAPPPAEGCATPNPAAGTLQFSAASFSVPEWGGASTPIVVTRSGGSSGAVSVAFNTGDGSATAGSDYTPTSTRVHFGDGDSQPRVIEVPLVHDTVPEADKTVQLALSDPGGCATLGTQASAVLTIVDDDRPLPLATFTVGGTLTGLVGTSPLLQEVVTGGELRPASNGSFTFDRRLSGNGRYDVRVITQPTNPTQICNVINGSGMLANANVADVAVNCATPPAPAAGLDPTFGTAGKVTVGLPGGGKALGLQRLGKIVVLGDMRLVRYNTDGSIDTTFGNAGTVQIAFEGTLLGDEANALAIQADDKIVVAGFTRFSGTDQRMAVARFNADGSVDASFGNAGRTSVDPYATVPNRTSSHSSAQKLLIQPDGKIVAVGSARFSADGVPSGINLAALRLNADGTPDMVGPGAGFGGDGASTIEVGGDVDIAYGVALQSDGKLVLAGRAGDNVNVNIGLARLKTDGILDTDTVLANRTPEHYGRDGSGVVNFGLAGWDEAADILMLANNHIVVAVQRQVGLHFQFTLYRFDDDGDHLTASVVSTPIGPGSDFSRALAVQPDGKFVVVGTVSSGTVNDFGIVRYNADLTLDTSFGTGGILLVDFFGASDGASDVVIQPDGKIIVVGVARNGTSNVLGMIRLTP